MYEHLLFTLDGKIARITLNRPDNYNAINDKISYELQDALKVVSKNKEARVLILTGAGKAFCSGQDLKEISGKQKRSLAESLHQRYNPIIRAITTMPKPVICGLNGVAAGAGFSLVLACDFIVASEKTTLIEVFINVGLIPDSGSSFFIPRAVGLKRAFEFCTMATKINADDALSMGLINRVVKEEELETTILQIATYYSTAPTKSIAMIKKMLYKSLISSLDQMLEYEAYCQEIAGNSVDYKEGLSAFNGKRKPIFTGE